MIHSWVQRNTPDRWVIVVVGAKPAVGWKYARSWLEMPPRLVGYPSAVGWQTSRSWLEELGSYGSTVSLTKPAGGWKYARNWLEISPQYTGNTSAASWKSVRSWLADFRSGLEICPQLVGNYFALILVQSMACQSL